ncbi:uncharacterized protein LOC114955329 [Acropora millepora]|uniref:uncharacterized protein LOC114955329 n=1 Tax=Acropora millepora TaxID=45264 RepID=UPI001CF2B28B|nr:uncharacterized protein LOC114955329 [Acropora millepora]
MAEANSPGESSFVKTHHRKNPLSYNRAKYREAQWERAVKVYTINLESKYILVQGVPAVGASKELVELFALYGAISHYWMTYPAEPFTEVYWIKFQRISSARVAKKRLDNRSFFGGILHVCYAPEFETVEDTREKLQERRKVIAKKTRELFSVQPEVLSSEMSRTIETSLKRPKEGDSKPCSKQHIEDQAICGKVHQASNSINSQSEPWFGGCPAEQTTSSSFPFHYPALPPPPQHLYPCQYPPPPPPWELPKVPSSHATLPVPLQNLPPPPPPPPPPPTDVPPLEDTHGKEQRDKWEHPVTVYVSRGMIGPQPEQGFSSSKASLTGDVSLDQTTISIRKKMQKLSRTREDPWEATPSIHIVENAGEQIAATVTKKKRKRI